MKWTEKDIEYIRNNRRKSNREIAIDLGCSRSAVQNAITKFGLQRSAETRYKIASRYFFGAENQGYRPPKGVHLSKKTEFKKGNLPVNTKYDGCVSVRNHKRDGQTLFIRVSKAKWVSLARYNWVKSGNTLPKGWVIRHKDGDTLNCNIENLYCIPRKGLLEENRNYEKAKETNKINHPNGFIRQMISTTFGKENTDHLIQVPEVVEFVIKRRELNKGVKYVRENG